MKMLTTRLGERPSLMPLAEAQAQAVLSSRFKEPVFHFHWHYHLEVELVWIRQGSGLRYTGRSVHPFDNEDLVLLAGNVSHTWCSAPDQRGPADWTVVWCHPEQWGTPFWRLPQVTKLRALLEEAKNGLQFTGQDLPRIGTLMEEMAELPPYSFDTLAVFFEICRRLLAAPRRSLNAGVLPMTGKGHDPRLQQVLSWIDARAQEPLSQAQVAALVKMQPSIFSRWFKERMGRTFQRYLNEVRIARVCARLAGGQESITTIALDCGYNNLANFNRRFLEIGGLTPHAFRTQSGAPPLPESRGPTGSAR